HNGDSPRRLARMDVVGPEDVDPRRDVLHEVVLEDHVLYGRPRRVAVLVSDREENREPVLGVRPVVLEDVALDEYSPRVLQLEQVLDGPGDAFEFVSATPPGERLRHV